MDIINYLVKEGNAIMQAPVIFTTLLILMGLAIWKIVGYHYGERIAVLETSVSHYKSLADKTAPTSFALNQDQYAQLVQHLSRFTMASGEKAQRIVAITVAVGAMENEAFALRVTDALIDAGWHAKYEGQNNDVKAYRSGVWIFGKSPNEQSPPTSQILKDALAKAGIQSNVDRPEDAYCTYLVIGRCG
jgi:hypothetical protein